MFFTKKDKKIEELEKQNDELRRKLSKALEPPTLPEQMYKYTIYWRKKVTTQIGWSHLEECEGFGNSIPVGIIIYDKFKSPLGHFKYLKSWSRMPVELDKNGVLKVEGF